MNKVVLVTLRDGLALPSGFVARSSHACAIYCRVPPDWIEGDSLAPERLEAVYEKLYGPTWREGNDDGSSYAVLSLRTHVLTDEEERSAGWKACVNTSETQYWFYRADPSGWALVDSTAGEL